MPNTLSPSITFHPSVGFTCAADSKFVLRGAGENKKKKNKRKKPHAHTDREKEGNERSLTNKGR